jgi:hypothetical protein
LNTHFEDIILLAAFSVTKFPKCTVPSQPKRIGKRGSVLKVRGGCYNYRFKLYKGLNVATKTVHSSKFIIAKHLK